MKLEYIGPYETARVNKYDLEKLFIGKIVEVSKEAGEDLLKGRSFKLADKNAKTEKDWDGIKKSLDNMKTMEDLRDFAKANNLKSKDNDKITLRKELLKEIKKEVSQNGK